VTCDSGASHPSSALRVQSSVLQQARRVHTFIRRARRPSGAARAARRPYWLTNQAAPRAASPRSPRAGEHPSSSLATPPLRGFCHEPQEPAKCDTFHRPDPADHSTSLRTEQPTSFRTEHPTSFRVDDYERGGYRFDTSSSGEYIGQSVEVLHWLSLVTRWCVSRETSVHRRGPSGRIGVLQLWSAATPKAGPRGGTGV
jgi:hypothetical protein